MIFAMDQTTATLSGQALALLVIGVLVVTVAVRHILTQHILPSRSHASFAELVNLPRRHLESLNSWEARTLAAHNERDAASKAFIEEATRLGDHETFPNGAAGAYFLPIDNPIAIRLNRARNGSTRDGDHMPGNPSMLTVRVVYLRKSHG